ncbi:MAG: phenylalanine--tRNA ligase subunit beta, partial [Candidatus Omnitrophica bacterium]|nr:phenylalanine--tRNA ligase subunit beta [Candidatus Omnitrophota bacterium]
MLFNFEAIKSYVDWKGTVTELCDLLTQLGFEVEDLCAPPDICSSLVVGRILSREPHPKADKLSLCQVDAGNGKPLQIVCGASNHQVGDHVVVARHGQELPGGLTIEEREVRGILSQGMMCSAREIGVGDDHEGILILPETAPVGAAASNYLTSIDLNIT